MITYWIRIGCEWRRVTTSLKAWSALPHVVGVGIGCTVVGAGAWLVQALPGILSAPQGDVDAVLLPTPVLVPEPSTWALLGLGVVVCWAIRRKRCA